LTLCLTAWPRNLRGEKIQWTAWLMADVSGDSKRKRHHVRGAECVLPLE
jgi:hypothetical protein